MKHLLLPLFLAASFGLNGCGGKTNADPTDTAADKTATAKPEPETTSNGQELVQSIEISGHNYKISICCKADKAAPIVTDDIGTQFYDNLVEVKVTKDDAPLFRRTFHKTDFADQLEEKEKAGTILLGMALNEQTSDASYIRFASQIGEPGLEGGPSFNISVSTADGSCAIQRNTQPTEDVSEVTEDEEAAM